MVQESKLEMHMMQESEMKTSMKEESEMEMSKRTHTDREYSEIEQSLMKSSRVFSGMVDEDTESKDEKLVPQQEFQRRK